MALPAGKAGHPASGDNPRPLAPPAHGPGDFFRPASLCQDGSLPRMLG